MARLVLTREMASAAGMDAGNCAMRQRGAKVWNEQDYAAACRECNRLMDIIDGGLCKKPNSLPRAS